MTDPSGEPTAAPSLRSLLTDKMGALAIRSGQIIIVLALAVIVVFALVQLKLVVIPVLIAVIIAAAASPVMRFLKKHGMSAIAATWLTLLAGILVIGGLITLIVFAVRNQWDTLASSAKDGLDQLQEFITTGPIPVDAEQIESAKQALIDFATSSQVGSGALAGASIVGSLATGAALAVVILFFFLKDGPAIWAFFLRPFSGHRKARGERIGATAVRVLGGYVRGTAIIAFVDAAGIGIGLAILQVPLALPLAVIVFVTAFIPIVGATAAGILAALVALVANGPVVALIVILIVVAVNQLEGNFLQPVVMAQSLKLHPLVILVALTAGTILGGITGAVLAVPIAAVGWAIVKTWNEDTPSPVAGSPAKPGSLAQSAPASKTARAARPVPPVVDAAPRRPGKPRPSRTR